MKEHLSELTAVWTADGRITPRSFIWQGREIQVIDSGRSWRDGEGYHILCRAAGSAVFELILGPTGEWILSAPEGLGPGQRSGA